MNDAPSSAPTRTALPAGLQRIRWIAHCVRAMALIAMVGLVGFHAVFWTDAAWVERSMSQSSMSDTALQYDAVSRASALVANLPFTLLTLFALLSLWRLFGGYLRGEVFSDAASRHLRRIGQSVTLMALAMPLTDTATVLALTLGNPPGQRVLAFHLGSTHYVVLLLGLVLTAIAAVMREAHRMAQENAEFI